MSLEWTYYTTFRWKAVCTLGCLMGQVVSHWPLTAKASVWCWANPCEICGWQSCTETGSPNPHYFGFLMPLSFHLCSIFFNGLTVLLGPRPPPLLRYHTHNQLRHITLGRTPLHESSDHHRDLYLTIHNRQTSTPLVGFEPAIPECERPLANTRPHSQWNLPTVPLITL